MRQDALIQQRLKLIGWLFAAAGFIVIIRLFYLQVVRHEHYQVLADRNHYAKFVIPPARGEIYMQDGQGVVPVVLNETKYRLYGDPRFIDDPSHTATELAKMTKQSTTTYQEKLERKDTAYVVLEQQLSHKRADAIKGRGFKGIGLTAVPTRSYPEGSLGSQTFGFVNHEGKGQYGIEQALDHVLTGKPGLLSGAVDVRGIPIATADNVEREAQDGSDIVLTIDRNLQAHSERVLGEVIKAYGARSGDVLVLDMQNGSIRAMASAPRFDPNKSRRSVDLSLFTNPIITGSYEPGSIAKVFTMAVGLDSGVVRPHTTFRDTSRREIDGFTIRNSETRPVASRTMRDVIRLSLNTGSIFILERLGGGEINEAGKAKLHDFLTQKLLLTTKTDLPLSGNVSGQIDPPDNISDVRYANITFGQGMQLTMARMAAAYAAILNGGNYYEPQLVEKTIHKGRMIPQSPAPAKTGIVKASTSRTLVAMMRAVVEEGAARIAQRPGYLIGGKTGTAQKPDPVAGGYSRTKVTSSFVGFIGTDKPKYLVLTRVDEPRRGGIPSAAVSTFAAVSDWLIEYYALEPRD